MPAHKKEARGRCARGGGGGGGAAGANQPFGNRSARPIMFYRLFPRTSGAPYLPKHLAHSCRVAMEVWPACRAHSQPRRGRSDWRPAMGGAERRCRSQQAKRHGDAWSAPPRPLLALRRGCMDGRMVGMTTKSILARSSLLVPVGRLARLPQQVPLALGHDHRARPPIAMI